MKYVLAGLAVALSTGSVAMASDQLARQLGVEPGVYTLAELTEIKAAQDDNDPLRLKAAMGRAGGDVIVSTQSIAPVAGMNEQLGRAIRVDSTDYTTSELAALFVDETT